jgi:hypothetical protein
MTAPTVTAATQDYLSGVERELADLPAEERVELLEDLALHLAALVEEGGREQPWESRLGDPAAYARELRAAAGLPERPERRPSPVVAIRGLTLRLWSNGVARELRTFLPQLRPAWWILRGYLVVLLPSLRHVNHGSDFPVPAPAGSHAFGVLLTVLAVVASVALGRRRLPRIALVPVLVGNLALVLLGLNLYDHAAVRLTHVRVVHGTVQDYATGLAPLVSRHGPVTNVLPYTADGKPLSGVLLFDQDGRPLLTALQQWWPDRCARVLAQPLAADHVAVRNSYPQHYVLTPGAFALSGQDATHGACQLLPRAPKVPIPVFPKAQQGQH